MIRNIGSTLLLALLAAANLSAQTDVKAFFQQLPSAKALPSYEELLQAVDQIPKLSKQDAQALLPFLMADLKYDNDVGIDAALGLFNVARRPDSGELLQPHMADIIALFGRSDTRFKATANTVLGMMKPPAVNAPPLLAAFILGPTGSPHEKADSLAVMLDITHGTAPQGEAAALHLLNMPMDPGARHAVLLASGHMGPSATKKVMDRIATFLSDSNEQVQIAAIQAFVFMGRAAVAEHGGDLAKLANDSSQTATVRRLAQDVIDGKDARCTTLQGAPIKPCN